MRKTNLFYTHGSDSKFLTFSNYTESLTGNFISTNTKIFPSTFMCLEIDRLCDGNGKLKQDEKEMFINNYLVSYYENKLAVLRDDCIKRNENCEEYLTPLAYLLKAIQMYDSSFKINYINDITEEDYNGTFTDTICVINFNKYYACNDTDFIKPDQYPFNIIATCDETSYLYGWTKDEMISWFINYQGLSYVCTPQFDSESIENITNTSLGEYKYIENDIAYITVYPYNELQYNKSIKFNVVIPLYDVTDINYTTNDHILEDDFSRFTSYDWNLKIENDTYRKYVPLGIWFGDKMIELTKDEQTGFSETWSLVISSQFKPFPYAKMQVDNPNANSNSNAFPTFAQVLAKQNEILDKFSYFEAILSYQNNLISDLNGKLNNVNTSSNIDSIKKTFIKSEYEMTKKFNNLKQEVYDVLNNLRWKGAE